MPSASTIPVVPLLLELLRQHGQQEVEDREAEERVAGPVVPARQRTPWEAARSLLFQAMRVTTRDERDPGEKLAREYDLPEGPTRDESALREYLVLVHLEDVPGTSPLSSELVRLEGEGFGTLMAESLRQEFPEEMQEILATVARNPPATRQKRSTKQGDARNKLIAALTQNHMLTDGQWNLEPVGNNELARRADVAPSTAKAFFDKTFGGPDREDGHGKYQVMCRKNPARVRSIIKGLNGEFPADDLFGRTPPGEGRDADS
ncbi:MAG TPA: hypothetical protein VG013_01045 [Gemmataceae bacterium]|jgi:hypothetical protein|nr:hypothetical protein [Gemmataceae bacterium]